MPIPQGRKYNRIGLFTVDTLGADSQPDQTVLCLSDPVVNPSRKLSCLVQTKGPVKAGPFISIFNDYLISSSKSPES